MKRFILVLGLILSLVVVSAYDVDYKERFVEARYFPDDAVVVSRTIWADYDNDDRLSSYEYRHGYSYRDSRDYFERKHDLKRYDYYDYRNSRDLRYYDDYRYYNSGVKGYVYEYVPHMRTYEKRECYFTPPNKLFYFKC